ncbi:hydrogenase maturation protease [Bacteroidota bacterium]
MNLQNKELLVLGVGNDILMDDGIGPKLTRALQQKFNYDFIRYDTLCLGGMELLEYIQGYKNVVFIDAIKTLDGIPGSVYYYTPDDFKETLHLSNLHDVSFLTALKMGKEIGLEIPKQIDIIAVEIIEDMVFGESFTPPLEAKYDEIFNEVSQFIESIIDKFSEEVKN